METRYPVYATADITVESRDVPHEAIVGEIIDALTERLMLASDDRGCGAEPGRGDMSIGKPLATPGQDGEQPTRIAVALGDRSYEVLIGPGLLARAARR